MFTITEDKTIYLTRGDVASIEITANTGNNEPYVFQIGDVVRFKVFVRKQCCQIVLQKDVIVESATETVNISLTSTDSKMGEIINKPVDYWYEIELNPDTNPQTIIGYDSDGPKILRLFPEGGEVT